MRDSMALIVRSAIGLMGLFASLMRPAFQRSPPTGNQWSIPCFQSCLLSLELNVYSCSFRIGSVDRISSTAFEVDAESILLRSNSGSTLLLSLVGSIGI